MSDQATPPPAGPAGTVQCEITRQWVPEDEIITIQGHRVCAEGKAELLERLRSGELMPGELERPTVLRRFGCAFLDGLILGIINAALGVMVVGAAFAGAGAPGGTNPLGGTFAALQVVLAAISLLYYTLLHGKYGQTLGKMAGKLKVVNDDGSPISMGTAFVRALYWQGPGVVASLILAAEIVMRATPTMTISQTFNFVVLIYIVTSIVMALMDRAQQRAIHDRLAKTRVIRLG